MHALSATHLTQRPRGLVWSEHWYLLAVACAVVLAVSLPEWGLNRSPWLRHLPLALTLPALTLTLAGRRLAAPGAQPGSVAPVLASGWPFLLLALFIVAGSLYARLFEGIRETFANLGLYMLAALAAAIMVAGSAAPAQLVRACLRIVLLAALYMSAQLLANYGGREVYHEQIFLVVPMAVYCALAPWPRFWAGLGALWFLGMTLLSAKNTTYLVALLVLTQLALLLWLPRIDRAPSIKRIAAHYAALVALLLVATLVAWLIVHRETHLPSGNVEYRAHTYTQAWRDFQESPLVGTLFNSPSVRKFTLYSIGIARNRLPTHSDLLDLLANGGLLAIGLWGLGYARTAGLSFRRLLASRFLHYPWSRYAHTLAAISLAGLVTYAFNPILLQPGLAYVLWTCLGLLLGLALRWNPARAAGEDDQPIASVTRRASRPFARAGGTRA